MIIAALLSLLGVEVWIILIVVGLLFWRSRWVKRRPGSFKCAIRRASGVVEGVPETFKLGYGGVPGMNVEQTSIVLKEEK